MPILYNKKNMVLFIHIPKCGGTSIETTAKKNQCNIELFDSKSPILKYRKCSPQHYHYSILNELIDISKINYKFAIVRNPIERIKSEYIMRNKSLTLEKRPEFNQWVELIFEKYKKNNFILDNHIRPQVEFLGEEIEIFKLENDMTALYDKLRALEIFDNNSAIEHIKHNNKSTDLSKNDIYISNKTFNLIHEFYSDDFKELNY